MKRTLPLLVCQLLLSCLAMGQQAHYGRSAANAAVFIPDKQQTPGVIRTSDAREICAKSFRTAPFRKTTAKMKNSVYSRYGVRRNKGVCKGGCEVDHLVPLELGGLDDVKNLWPQPSQPVPGFHEKDKLENYLKHAVCAEHSMELWQAQQELIGDWYEAYERFLIPSNVKPCPKSGCAPVAAMGNQ